MKIHVSVLSKDEVEAIKNSKPDDCVIVSVTPERPEPAGEGLEGHAPGHHPLEEANRQREANPAAGAGAQGGSRANTRPCRKGPRVPRTQAVRLLHSQSRARPGRRGGSESLGCHR